MQTFSAVNLAHYLVKAKLDSAKCVVDATTGNGNDTLFLASHTATDAKVWAFDIQEEALQKAHNLLNKNGLLEKVRLIQDSHAHLSRYIQSGIDVIMFNLGYLPGSDHTIMTTPEITLIALQQSIHLLNLGGVVTVIAYPGHATGKLEQTAVQQFLSQLSPSIYAVTCCETINHPQNPPVLYVIEKVRCELREGITPR